MPPPTDNLTAVLHKVGDLRLEQRPIPEPKDDEVLLRMECVGICGSDVHYLTHGQIGPFVVKKPMVIGHEASGTVVKVGAKVKNLKPGDRVAIEPGVPCRICSYCKEGKYNICEDMVFCATPPYDGNLSRYYTHAADFCYKLPDHVTLEEGALLEPLSVGVHACRRANIQIGSIVLILGAGPIGLVSLVTAKAMGAECVIVTDLLADRLEVAKKLGANFILQVDKNETEKVIGEKIQNILKCQPDKTIDAIGAESTIRLAIEATRGGGTVIIVGLAADEVKIPLINALTKEVDIRGIFRYCNDYPIALSLVASGKVNIKSLITHRYKLEETIQAFETARTGSGGAIKVMIYCNPNYEPCSC